MLWHIKQTSFHSIYVSIFCIDTSIWTGRTLKPDQGCVQWDAVLLQIVDLLISAPYHEHDHRNQHPMVCQFNFEQSKEQVNGIKQIADITGSREENAVDPF